VKIKFNNREAYMRNIQFHPIAEIFPLIHGHEFVELKADIAVNGVVEPIWLYEGKILDGRNRFRAAQEVGVEPTFRDYEGDDPLGFTLSLNLHRRHLSEAQRAMVAGKIANMDKNSFRGNQTVTANLQEAVSSAKAAEMLNVSERSVNTAKAIQRDGDSTLQQAVTDGRVSLHAAADIATRPKEEQRTIVATGEREILAKAKEIRAERAQERRQDRIEKIVEISKGNTDLVSDQKYPVIYADPPWRYEHSETESRAIENQYPTMPLDDICALNVPATDDAILFLWTTAPKLEEGMRVMNEWGFTYRSCAIWDKQKMGMGYYFRIQHEILMIGTKGSIPTPEGANRPRSVFTFPSGEHSAKPTEVAAMIEAMYPDLPKLEMFCRSPRAGWGVWGNQSAA
jgi:N6-adenosine-specific RNA methylase IME4/ParB-like chromosome segregation protein Spo0J